jgi:hypothetical protein
MENAMSISPPSRTFRGAEATVYRPLVGPVRLKLPYAGDNGTWLKSLGIRHASWNKQRHYWELPRSSWQKAVAALCQRFDTVRDVRDNRVKASLDCNAKCQNASGPDCVCSCGGRYHQTGVGGAPVGDSAVVVLSDIDGVMRTERFHRAP